MRGNSTVTHPDARKGTSSGLLESGAPARQPAATTAGRAASAPVEPLLVVEDLRVRFTRGGRRINAVNGLSYELPPGRMLAIIGESGSGKSVSTRALMGLLPATAQISGSVLFDGRQLIGMPEQEMRALRGGDIAMVFQDPARSLNPTMRIGTQITEAIRVHSDVDKKAARDRAIELLRMVRLPAPERRFHEYPHQLSGGMRQRVMIAIALAGNPRLLIADEATTALDVTTQAQIMELIVELQERLGMAVIMISHDLGLAASYAQDVVVMYAGRAVESAPTQTLFAHVRMPYTRALLGAIPALEREPHSLLPVTPGQPPDLSALPKGCPFRPRCPRATDTCVEMPAFEEHEPQHSWACWHPTPDDAPDGGDR
jgi:oligopeptide/dipeptide ABC transporter ATP-binding protein